MTKIMSGTCEAGQVLVDDNIIKDCIILSDGIGASDGLVLINHDRYFYIANTTSDLKTLLEKVIDALTNIDLQFTAMAAFGGAPANAAVIAELTIDKEGLK